MQKTKVQFSPDEIRLMTDASWILTKNAVIAKIYEGMARLSERMQVLVQAHGTVLPHPFASSGAKISRGENYQGLPYVMMDYPKVFGREEILAVRTFFWWGKYCSITLHTKGSWATPVLQQLSAGETILAQSRFYFAGTGDEWNHDLESGSYGLLTENGKASSNPGMQDAPFLKLAARVELDQWESMEDMLYQRFEVLMTVLTNSLEKGLR